MLDRSELLEAVAGPLNFALYFEDEGFGRPHYYIILPTQNKDEVVVLSMITSQIDKKKEFYKDDEASLQNLVYVDENDLSFLIKPSVIDCNSSTKTTVSELSRMSKLRLIRNLTISRELIIRIAKAINASKLTKPSIKKSIDLSKI